MSKRERKGRGTARVLARKDGTMALRMKLTVKGVDYVKTINLPPRRQIEAARVAFAADVHSGAFGKAKAARKLLAAQPTLAEWSEVFLQSHVSQDPDRAATRAAYGNMLRLYILPAIGEHKLADITTPMVRDLMQDLYKRGRAIKTIKLANSVLHRCMDAAIEDEVLDKSPMPKFGKLRLGSGETARESAARNALSMAQVTALLDACGHPLRLWVAIMASAGLRPGEANGLRWQDVDVKAGALHVRGAAKIVFLPGDPGRKGHIWIGKPKTPSSMRTVTIGPTLAELLADERDQQEALQRELRALPINVATAKPLLLPDACVFCRDPGSADGLRQPMNPRTLSAQFKRAAARAGLSRKVSPHWLRHTAISHNLADGTPLANASLRAGHKSPATTAAIYAHALGEGEAKGAMSGDRLLSSRPKTPATNMGRHKGPR